MHNNNGNLSVDFLVGFTIFILAFIWVATMIPMLFVGLNAHSIDYNAVAYRTSVILAEDPGAAGPVSETPCFGISSASGSTWESTITAPTKCDIARFGLAVSKDTPNVLDENKVNRFFCWTESSDPKDKNNLSYPDDYLKRAIFGDYPYRFNISLKIEGENQTRYVGEDIPDVDYGYIRRTVMVKSPSNATIDANIARIKKYGYNNTENVSLNQFSIELNQAELKTGISGFPHETDYPAYQINPGSDGFIINITELNETRNKALFGDFPDNCELVGITFYERSGGGTYLSNITSAINYNLTVNGSYVPATLPAMVNDSISLAFKPGAFSVAEKADPKAPVFINLTFRLTPPQQYLNNTLTHPFEYNYDPANVTQPQLHPGVLEVAVW